MTLPCFRVGLNRVNAMYFFKTPLLIRSLFPGLIWNFKTKVKVIYLTFDDGPVPEATPWVLDCLKEFDAKATFFMVGDNVRKHPEVYQRVLQEGHRVANHTFNHLKGWRRSTMDYLENIRKAEEFIQQGEEQLFRPPYGQISLAQIKALKDNNKIVMWDVLSGDFDKELNPDKCLRKTIGNTNKGSIVVFHDSVKTIDKLKIVLPQYLEHFSRLGFKFNTL
jgi:peptidoglycan/xylan/chitin deacetylase (PgdA/CDA1 family)